MRHALSTVLSLTLVAAGCGNDDHGSMMTGSRGGMMGSGSAPGSGYVPTLLAMTPVGGAVGVPTSVSIALRFGAPMAAGMEQYVDLHLSGIDGPIVPMACEFSSDRTILTCTPNASLASGTTYLLHVGAGVTTQDGQPVNYDHYGPGMGGSWIMGGMMGRGHAGHAWSTMGPGWRGPNGSYGMEFPFTTA